MTPDELRHKGFLEQPDGSWAKGKAPMNTYITELRKCDGPMNEAESKRLIANLAKGKRVRQSAKPLMNKLETECFNSLAGKFPNFPRPIAQAVRFRLGNGIWFKPDVFCPLWPQKDGPAKPTCYEVKGPHAFRGGFENLKVAASLYPDIAWFLVWKDNGQWQEQRILA